MTKNYPNSTEKHYKLLNTSEIPQTITINN